MNQPQGQPAQHGTFTSVPLEELDFYRPEDLSERTLVGAGQRALHALEQADRAAQDTVDGLTRKLSEYDQWSLATSISWHELPFDARFLYQKPEQITQRQQMHSVLQTAETILGRLVVSDTAYASSYAIVRNPDFYCFVDQVDSLLQAFNLPGLNLKYAEQFESYREAFEAGYNLLCFLDIYSRPADRLREYKDEEGLSLIDRCVVSYLVPFLNYFTRLDLTTTSKEVLFQQFRPLASSLLLLKDDCPRTSVVLDRHNGRLPGVYNVHEHPAIKRVEREDTYTPFTGLYPLAEQLGVTFSSFEKNPLKAREEPYSFSNIHIQANDIVGSSGYAEKTPGELLKEIRFWKEKTASLCSSGKHTLAVSTQFTEGPRLPSYLLKSLRAASETIGDLDAALATILKDPSTTGKYLAKIHGLGGDTVNPVRSELLQDLGMVHYIITQKEAQRLFLGRIHKASERCTAEEAKLIYRKLSSLDFASKSGQELASEFSRVKIDDIELKQQIENSSRLANFLSSKRFSQLLKEPQKITEESVLKARFCSNETLKALWGKLGVVVDTVVGGDGSTEFLSHEVSADLLRSKEVEDILRAEPGIRTFINEGGLEGLFRDTAILSEEILRGYQGLIQHFSDTHFRLDRSQGLTEEQWQSFSSAARIEDPVIKLSARTFKVYGEEVSGCQLSPTSSGFGIHPHYSVPASKFIDYGLRLNPDLLSGEDRYMTSTPSAEEYSQLLEKYSRLKEIHNHFDLWKRQMTALGEGDVSWVSREDSRPRFTTRRPITMEGTKVVTILAKEDTVASQIDYDALVDSLYRKSEAARSRLSLKVVLGGGDVSLDTDSGTILISRHDDPEIAERITGKDSITLNDLIKEVEAILEENRGAGKRRVPIQENQRKFILSVLGLMQPHSDYTELHNRNARDMWASLFKLFGADANDRGSLLESTLAEQTGRFNISLLAPTDPKLAREHNTLLEHTFNIWCALQERKFDYPFVAGIGVDQIDDSYQLLVREASPWVKANLYGKTSARRDVQAVKDRPDFFVQTQGHPHQHYDAGFNLKEREARKRGEHYDAGGALKRREALFQDLEATYYIGRWSWSPEFRLFAKSVLDAESQKLARLRSKVAELEAKMLAARRSS